MDPCRHVFGDDLLCRFLGTGLSASPIVEEWSLLDALNEPEEALIDHLRMQWHLALGSLCFHAASFSANVPGVAPRAFEAAKLPKMIGPIIGFLKSRTAQINRKSCSIPI